jgi:thioredoxin-dependent peroxiredoxin
MGSQGEVSVRHLFSAFLTAALTLAASVVGAQTTELKVGDQAPDFSLKGSDGKTWKLSDLKGKTVVLAWFPKAFTGGCTAQCKSLKENSDAIRAFDVAYFAASVDDAETNKKFAESLELDYPVLSDPGKDVARAYGVVNGMRPVAQRWTFYIGPDGKIAYIDKQINTSNAGADTAARLEALDVPRNGA